VRVNRLPPAGEPAILARWPTLRNCSVTARSASGDGRGIATDAAAALTDAALGLPGIDRVEIYHDAANLASERIPAKLGYTRLGEQPARDLWPSAPGETGTDVAWQITR
jgi:RimJ/RimL family protein N-acetyltransferase